MFLQMEWDSGISQGSGYRKKAQEKIPTEIVFYNNAYLAYINDDKIVSYHMPGIQYDNLNPRYGIVSLKKCFH